MSVNSITVGGVTIPQLGLGTFKLYDDECTAIVAEGLKLGYRHVDTAAKYENEAAVGEGIRAGGLAREDIFLTTKVWYDQIADGALQASAEASLARLKMDYVDLLLIHWPSADVPVAEAVRALNDVKARGLTRAIGISNFPTALIEEAVAVSEAPLATNQVEYHPFIDQSAVMAALAKHDMALTAYCPLARGRILDDPVIGAIAARMGVTPSAVTLAWLLGQERVIAIPKTSNLSRLADNFAAASLTLSPDDRAAIDALAEPGGRLVDPAWAPQWDVEAA